MAPERPKNNDPAKGNAALVPQGRFLSKGHRKSDPHFEELSITVPTYVEGADTRSVVAEITKGGMPEGLAPWFFKSSGVPHRGIWAEIRAKRKEVTEKDGVEILGKNALMEVTIVGDDDLRCPETRRKSFAYTFHVGEDPVLSIDRLAAPYDMQPLFAKQLPGVREVCLKLGVTKMRGDAFSAFFGGTPEQEYWEEMQERMGKRLDYLERYLPYSVVKRLRSHLRSSNPKALWDIVDENLEMPKKAIDGNYPLCGVREIRGLPIKYTDASGDCSISGLDATGKMTVGLDLLNSAVSFHVDEISHPFHFKKIIGTLPVFEINLEDPQVVERMENWAKNWGVEARRLSEQEAKELLAKRNKTNDDIARHQKARRAEGLYAFSPDDLQDTMVKFKGTPQEWDQIIRVSPQDAQELLTRGLDLEEECLRKTPLNIDLETGKQTLDLNAKNLYAEIRFPDEGDVLEICLLNSDWKTPFANARQDQEQLMSNVLDFSLQTKRKAIHFSEIPYLFQEREMAEMGLIHSPKIWEDLWRLAEMKLSSQKSRRWRNDPELAERCLQKIRSIDPKRPRDFWNWGKPDVEVFDGDEICLSNFVIENFFRPTSMLEFSFILDLTDEEAVQRARQFLQKPESEDMY